MLESPLDGAVCPRCWAAARAAAGEYAGPLRDIIQAFKYEGRRSLAAPLATLMRDAGVDVLHGASCAVPVPLHPWKRIRRGFNQADDLARHTGIPVVHALWRVRLTRAQAGLDASARRRNMRGAFRLAPWLSAAAHARFIDGQVVVVVDDVKTTGATLEACVEVLREAGARDVRTLTVARAALHH